MTAEAKRLQENRDRTAHWRRWGPYLSDRQWGTVREDYTTLGKRWLYAPENTELLFTENETNFKRLFDTSNISDYVKDGINDYVVHGCKKAINPDSTGTKVAKDRRNP